MEDLTMKAHCRFENCLFVIVLSIFSSYQTFSQANYWKQTSSPPGGEILAIAENSSEDIFTGSSNGGCYRSSNGGAS